MQRNLACVFKYIRGDSLFLSDLLSCVVRITVTQCASVLHCPSSTGPHNDYFLLVCERLNICGVLYHDTLLMPHVITC